MNFTCTGIPSTALLHHHKTFTHLTTPVKQLLMVVLSIYRDCQILFVPIKSLVLQPQVQFRLGNPKAAEHVTVDLHCWTV